VPLFTAGGLGLGLGLKNLVLFTSLPGGCWRCVRTLW